METMLDQFARSDPRADRFYYYQMVGDDRNDSGLLPYPPATSLYLCSIYAIRTTSAAGGECR